MFMRTFQTNLFAAAALAFSSACTPGLGTSSPWQEKFDIASCNLMTTGRSEYFVLEPGFQLVLEGGGTKLEIMVLNETKTVDGVNTRIVE